MFLDDELYQIAEKASDTKTDLNNSVRAMIDTCRNRIEPEEIDQDFKTSLKRINNSWNLCYDRILKKFGKCWFKRDGFKEHINEIFKDRADIRVMIWR